MIRRPATEAELEEGHRQIREAERRMAQEGITAFLDVGVGWSDSSGMTGYQPPTSGPVTFEPPRGLGGSYNPETPLAIGDESKSKKEGGEAEAEAGAPSEETELREAEAEGRRVEGQKQVAPLFSQEQLKRLEELERSAPLLTRRDQTVPRPGWMVEEEMKMEEMMKQKEIENEKREQQRMAVVLKTQEQMNVLDRIYMLEKENLSMKRDVEVANAENQLMRQRLKQIESPFGTPQEQSIQRPEFLEKEELRREEGGRREGFETPKKSRVEDEEKKDFNEKSMELMMKMMDSMQKLMMKKNGSPDVEMVRGNHLEVPKLQEWSAESAPLDLGDWFIMLNPVMGDLTPTSHLWWDLMMEEAREWYKCHQTLSPLERVSHRPVPSVALADSRWSRLERRASSLLLSALPEGQKEEMVATKNLTPLSMITRLMTVYQPGGLSEKSIILKALEQPPEAPCLSSALVGLRRWLRWKRRAEEVQVALPDPSVLVKGLNRLVRKILEANKELGFRISLAKTTLMVESVPREETVHKLAEHLVAEVESIAHLEMKGHKQDKADVLRPVVKKMEENGKGGEKGSSKGFGGSSDKMVPCKFFNMEFGCKKGKQCTFNHVLDDQRRCWTCGSTQHYAPKCDRPKEKDGEGKGASKGDGRSESKIAKVVKKEESPKKEDGGATQEDVSNEVMKDLLEEANKMLKTISNPKPVDEARDGKLERLQKQLDELRSLRVFRVARMEVNEEEGLIDSGATHSLRGWRRSDRHRRLRDIQVTLACGRKTSLKMTPGGTMVSEDPSTEPIVPMGKLMSVIGCKLQWTQDGGLVIEHPTKGVVKTKMRGGCPYVEKSMALEFIEELDCEGSEEDREIEDQEVRRIQELDQKEMDWVKDFINTHPVLSSLPQRVKDQLIKRPSTTASGIPGVNKRRRKLWYKKGLTLHLYSGERSGFGLERALKEQGGDDRLLMEVDVKNGKEFDMMKEELYEKLLRLALDDVLDCVIAGPNCRTRSMLRHIPKPGAPRPVRDWDGGVWGSKRNTCEEDGKVFEDDVMMWRFFTIALVALHVRRAQGEPKKEVLVLLEQPAEPEEFPQVVSFWRTAEWKKMKEMYKWFEKTFHQGDWGGRAPKPTTVGGSLSIKMPRRKEIPMDKNPVRDSKDLERWAPGMMREVARAIHFQVQEGSGDEVEFRKLSWEEHLRLGHTPFRRDCYVCQQSRQKQNPHRRQKVALSGVLSLDTAGPYRDGTDLVMTSRYMCVGAFTWAVPKGTKGFEEPEAEVQEGAPEVEEWKDGRIREEDQQGIFEEATGREVREAEETAEDEISPETGPHRREIAEDEISPETGPRKGELAEDEGSPETGPQEGEKVQEMEWEIKVFRMCCPMANKKSEEVLRVVMEFVLRLRTDGFWVSQIHTDQGHEYYGQLRAWCLKRGIVVTRTPGDDPQGNGRAEVAIQGITRQIRACLLQAEVGWEWWPVAARYVSEVLRGVRIGEALNVPTFLEEVLVRKRHWRRGVLMEPTCEKVKYLCPAWDHHGHWVMKEDGSKIVTRYYLKRLNQPVNEAIWVALEKELDDALTVRRRLREKTHPIFRSMKEAEEDKKKDLVRVSKVIEEEVLHMMDEDEEVVQEELKVIRRLKKMTAEPWEEDEVLQTKIVSPVEVQRNWKPWDEAAKSEVHSLLKEKEALEEVSKERVEEMKKKAAEEGKKIEMIPSKVVFTRKPGPGGGKPKVRWVVCGNFEEKKPHEENFSSGADATAFRVMVWMASQKQWSGASIDIKTAFLNADWDEENEETMVLVKPPFILVENGVLQQGKLYVPKKAVYGFRRSPRLWGNCRDMAMEEMDIELEGMKGGIKQKEVLKLKRMDSEPNLWKVVPRDEEPEKEAEVRGLVMTYVDDLFLVGSEGLVSSILGEIKRKWKTSEPEWVLDSPVRFLGLEVSKEKRGGEEVWFLTQRSYVLDMLRKEGEEIKKRKIPISRELAAELVDPEEEVLSEEIRRAQKAVGELLWLLTRSRPDLMYVMARMCSQVTKCPRKVVDVADQVKGYLRGSPSEGLRFEKGQDDEVKLRVYTDASFSPDGTESHGCVIVLLGTTPISWKSGRQSMVALSTAESELMEVVEGFALGEAAAVLVEEIVGEVVRTSYTDSQAAQAVMVNEGGSWRTRHLRMKAAHARQLIQQGVWSLHHVSGEDMIADVGTKPLASPRLKKLKKDMGMVEVGREDEEDRAENQEEEKEKNDHQGKEIPEEVKKILKIIGMAIQIRGAKAQGREEGHEGFMMIMAVTFLLAVVGFWTLLRICWRRCSKPSQPEEEPSSSSQERRMRDPEERREGEELRRRSPMTQRTSGEETPPPSLRQRGMSSTSTPQRSDPRTPSSMSSEVYEGLRSLMRRVEENMREPGGEPGTWREDLLGAAVFEGYQYPSDWDPEVHGGILAGKGSPPESYFQRMRGKGQKGRELEDEAGAEKGKKGAGKGGLEPEDVPKGGKGSGGDQKGRSASASHGVPGGGLGLTSSASSPRTSISGKGSGIGNASMDDQPSGCTGKGSNGRGVIYVTPYGTKFHTNPTCPSLARTRQLLPSPWCERCAGRDGDRTREFAVVSRPGGVAHEDSWCPDSVDRRVYRRCGLCSEMDRTR